MFSSGYLEDQLCLQCLEWRCFWAGPRRDFVWWDRGYRCWCEETSRIQSWWSCHWRCEGLVMGNHDWLCMELWQQSIRRISWVLICEHSDLRPDTPVFFGWGSPQCMWITRSFRFSKPWLIVFVSSTFWWRGASKGLIGWNSFAKDFAWFVNRLRKIVRLLGGQVRNSPVSHIICPKLWDYSKKTSLNVWLEHENIQQISENNLKILILIRTAMSFGAGSAGFVERTGALCISSLWIPFGRGGRSIWNLQALSVAS